MKYLHIFTKAKKMRKNREDIAVQLQGSTSKGSADSIYVMQAQSLLCCSAGTDICILTIDGALK